MEIRGKTISYSSFKSRTKRNTEARLISEIQEMEMNLSDSNKEKIEHIKNELHIIRTEKLKGNIIRSRAHYIDQGEKPTNYFCNLEKYHNTSKSIPFIEKEDGNILLNQKEILEETCRFYKTLYTLEKNMSTLDDIDYFTMDNKTLSQDQSDVLEGLLTYIEITTTLKKI